MMIRDFIRSDAAAMAQLYFLAARQLGARHYSPAQVGAWAPQPADPAAVQRRAEDGRVTLVAVSGERLVGYIDLEGDGHVDHLYVHPIAAGQGIGARLIDAMLARARTAGIKRLHVEASENARPLFERKGFAIQSRRALEVGGVAIHNYAMTREAL